jgi:hypothetical protein
MPVSVPVTAADPKVSLTRPRAASLRWICHRGRRRRPGPPSAGLIRSLAGPAGSCLITVLPLGDLAQAGADLRIAALQRGRQNT